MPVEPLTVPPADAGARLDAWLAARLGLARDRARALCEQGRVRIRGKACSPLRRLFGGEEVEVDRPAPRPRAASGPPLAVLHDDPSCLVVDKPAGLAVERSRLDAPSVAAAAARLGRFDVGGLAEPGVVHRLDRDTTGCLVLARTDLALQALLRAFERGEVEKEYLALVAVAPGADGPPEEGALDTPYGRRPGDARRFTTRLRSARRARLAFRVEARLRGAALLRVRLETGRTHQIRVQLAEAGWPVLGDALYGVTSPIIGRQALHAARLAFPSPEGLRVEVEAALPADLAAALAASSAPR